MESHLKQELLNKEYQESYKRRLEQYQLAAELEAAKPSRLSISLHKIGTSLRRFLHWLLHPILHDADTKTSTATEQKPERVYG